MRVISIYYTHKPGGFCKRLYRALGALRADGFETVYLTLDPPPAEFPASVEVRIIPFPIARRSGLLFWALFIVWAPVYLAFIARRFEPSLIFVFGAFYGAISRPASLLCGVPILLFIRSIVIRIDRITGKPVWIRRLSAAVDRLGVQGASRVVCMTEAMRAELQKSLRVEPRATSILPNEVRLPEDVPGDGGSARQDLSGIEFPVLTMGVLDRRKNISFLLEVFDGLLDTVPASRMTLFVAGMGPDRDQLESEASRRGLDNVRFLGWRSDIPDLIAASSLIVHPSLHEGVSNAVLEGLGGDRPVLASAVPEHREILGSERLCFALDNPRHLAGMLERFAADPGFRDELQRACRARAELLRFDWETRIVELARGELQNYQKAPEARL